jgi:nucleoside-diphosphate-sugar epimerase
MTPAQADFSSGLPPGARILVTGGSGFIGTNLVGAYRAAGLTVRNADMAQPRNTADSDAWSRVDITRIDQLREVVSEVRPTHVVHLAARTDLDGGEVSDYAANTTGVGNLLTVLAEAPDPVERAVIASSRLVCRIGYQPSSDEDYCPTTVYGASKVETERLVREAEDLPWVLVRPTSIWGPWFDLPYRDFFLSVARRRYVHPAGRRIHKSFGFVGNTTWHLHRLMVAPRSEVVGRTFYLADDPPIEVGDFANRISAALGQGRMREAPLPVLRALARTGDIVERAGRRAPLTSFRLVNLLTPMIHDLTPLTAVSGDPAFGLDAGVAMTVQWMHGQGLLDARPIVGGA